MTKPPFALDAAGGALSILTKGGFVVFKGFIPTSKVVAVVFAYKVKTKASTAVYWLFFIYWDALTAERYNGCSE